MKKERKQILLGRMPIRTVSLPHVVILADRVHVDVSLFNNRSQMTSKCGKNKKIVAHEVIAECVTDVLTTV